MGKRRKQSGIRKLIRACYRGLGILNTASYVLDAGTHPGKLAKHLIRRRTSKIGSRLVK